MTEEARGHKYAVIFLDINNGHVEKVYETDDDPDFDPSGADQVVTLAQTPVPPTEISTKLKDIDNNRKVISHYSCPQNECGSTHRVTCRWINTTSGPRVVCC